MATPEPMKMEPSNISLPMSHSAPASSLISSPEAPLLITSPVPTEPSAPAQPSSLAPSTSRLPDHSMHKNHLQEYAQRSNIQLPIYQTVNEGFAHAPRFRSTVSIDGKSYTSQNVFPSRKGAEQDAAKLALESISANIKVEVPPLIHENTIFQKTMLCKCILHEYAVKMNLDKITYDTVQREGLPVFVSSLVLHGKRYTGDPAKSKKEAEQLAARAAILSNLGNSVSGICLTEIIKSKLKFCAAAAAINNVKDSQNSYSNTVSPIANTGHTHIGTAPVAANDNEMQVALPECSSRVLPPRQELQMPKQEISPEDSKLSNVSLKSGVQQHIDASSSLKKRKKNRKKANKKSRLNTLHDLKERIPKGEEF